jgi:hypothetical protein
MVGHNLIRNPSLEHHAEQAHMDRSLPDVNARASSQTEQESSQIELEQSHNSMRVGRQILILSWALHSDLDHKDRSSHFVTVQVNNQNELELGHKLLRYYKNHVLVVPVVDYMCLLAHR